MENDNGKKSEEGNGTSVSGRGVDGNDKCDMPASPPAGQGTASESKTETVQGGGTSTSTAEGFSQIISETINETIKKEVQSALAEALTSITKQRSSAIPFKPVNEQPKKGYYDFYKNK